MHPHCETGAYSPFFLSKTLLCQLNVSGGAGPGGRFRVWIVEQPLSWLIFFITSLVVFSQMVCLLGAYTRKRSGTDGYSGQHCGCYIGRPKAAQSRRAPTGDRIYYMSFSGKRFYTSGLRWCCALDSSTFFSYIVFKKESRSPALIRIKFRRRRRALFLSSSRQFVEVWFSKLELSISQNVISKH